MPRLAELTEVAPAIEPASERQPIAPDSNEPFRILILGDFSARNHRAVFEPGQLGWRMPIPVDLDTIENVMLRLSPSLSLPIPGTPRRRIDLSFGGFSDFLPEQVYENLARLEQFPAEKAVPAIRYLLHHPDFQALESVWRCLFFLLLRVGAGGNVLLYLLDVTKQELADDLCTSYDIADSGFYRLLVRQSSIRAAHPWTLCVSDYSFSPYVEDIEILSRVARVARHAGTPFLGAVRHDWPSEPGLTWQMLRESPEAAYLGLATPRFLTRVPYDSPPGAEFPFLEIPAEPAPEDYLWGNPAFVCAALLADEFRREGWHMDPGQWIEMGGFSHHEFTVEGKKRTTHPTESELGEKELQSLLDRGVIPLVASPEGTAIRFPRLQSVKKPSTSLRGRW